MTVAASSRLADPQFAARLLRPDRAHAAEVAALARTARSAAELLEVCVARELVPLDWVDTMHDGVLSADAVARLAARACGGCNGWGESEAEDQGARIGYYGCGGCNGRGYVRQVWSVPLLAALASDAPGVLAAEALAREFVARIGAFLLADARGDARGIFWRQWRAMASGPVQYAGWSEASEWPFELRAMLGLLESLTPLAPVDDGQLRHAAPLRRALGDRALGALMVTALLQIGALADRWDAAVAAGIDPAVRGVANPFDPLLELFGRGYVLVTIAGSDAMLLGVPALTPG